MEVFRRVPLSICSLLFPTVPFDLLVFLSAKFTTEFIVRYLSLAKQKMQDPYQGMFSLTT